MNFLGYTCFIIISSIVASILDEKVNFGWFLTFLMFTFYFDHRNSSYLLIAGLFAIAGSITGFGRRFTDAMKEKEKKDA